MYIVLVVANTQIRIWTQHLSSESNQANSIRINNQSNNHREMHHHDASGRSFTIISDDTWVIPDDTWVISADTWVITDDTWVITDDTWVIPDDTWVIPDDTWVIPDDTWVIPGSLLWQVHPLVAMLLVWWSVPTEFLVLLFRHCILSFFVGVLPVPIELFPLITSLIPVPI